MKHSIRRNLTLLLVLTLFLSQLSIQNTAVLTPAEELWMEEAAAIISDDEILMEETEETEFEVFNDAEVSNNSDGILDSGEAFDLRKTDTQNVANYIPGLIEEDEDGSGISEDASFETESASEAFTELGSEVSPEVISEIETEASTEVLTETETESVVEAFTEAESEIPPELSTETEADTETVPVESVFEQSKTVNGVVVSVKAEPGVFPADAVLIVKSVPVYQQRQAEAVVNEACDENQNVAVSYTFDIKAVNPDTGEEYQPAEGRTVSVSFALAEVADENLTTNVYHVTEDETTGKLTAESLEVNTETTQETGEETTAVVETDGFSLYTVVFTYSDLQYILPGYKTVALSEILTSIGLTGEVTAVEISDTSLFEANKLDNEWKVTALQAFSSKEWMKLTINDVVYEITVTDDLLAAGTTVYNDGEKQTLNNPDTTYIIQGNGQNGAGLDGNEDGDYFTVPENSSSEGRPITIILDNVNRSQEGKSPDSSFLTIESGNYVIVKLRGTNYIKAGKDEQFFSVSDDGMAAIHVSPGSTVKVTSENGDGSTEGTLTAIGGGAKYGGAGIGTRYNVDTGTIIIAGGTIYAYGAHCAAGIGSGRDGRASNIQITGGDIHAWGGQYAAGIGAGDNVGGGEGGDTDNITITGGTIEAYGGDDPDGDLEGGAGIGCSEGGTLHGTIQITGGTIYARGTAQAAGIGGGEGKGFDDNGQIVITGGSIRAEGGSDGAGIGGGNGGDDIRVTIDQTPGSNLYIDAAGGKNAAGIGAGDGNAKYVNITLRGGTIYARGGENGAGIGAGDDIDWLEIKGNGSISATGGNQGTGIGAGNNSGVKGHLTIEGSKADGSEVRKGAWNPSTESFDEGEYPLEITASSSRGLSDNDRDNQAAAIGGGKGSNGNITIRNAKLTTHAGGQGADIGGGSFHATYGGTIDRIAIENCNITSTSTKKVTSGIGSGYGTSINHISISNTYYHGGGIGASLMDANYLGLNSVDSIEINNSDVYAEWDEKDPGHCTDVMNFTATDLEHGAAGIGSGQYGSMRSITIKNSNIYAHGFGSGAGIGTGGRGAYTLWIGLDKLDIGDLGTISIDSCSVVAKSGYADFSEGVPTTVGEITVDPLDLGSGAGIGSGCGSQCGEIWLSNCPSIYAKGFAGAGIGAGNASGAKIAGAVDFIMIDKCKYVDAFGGRFSAGIGTSGGDGGMRIANSSTLKGIVIRDCEHVYASGGSDAAGIGCGAFSSYETGHTSTGHTIVIENSGVSAHGGDNGAGIGGGCEHNSLGFGGDCPPTIIKGTSAVEAYGGKRAAGIGGGFLGGAKEIVIDLEEDDSCITQGTFDNPAPSRYYVKAVGQDGGAGIGGGGDDYVSGEYTKNSSTDCELISIKGGAVFAQGGASIQAGYMNDVGWGNTGDFKMGAGAGIGGSAGASHADKIEINHGYIWARGGAYTNNSDKACDIGTGGDYSNAALSNNDLSEDLIIHDGTVLTEKMDRFRSVTISGGSVQAKLTWVKNSSGTPVYQTTGKIDKDSPVFSGVPGAGRISVSAINSDSAFGKYHIYTSDLAGYAFWLYLPEYSNSTEKGLTADLSFGGQGFHYYGYTDTNNTGFVKIDGGTIGGKVYGKPVEGTDFDVYLLDDGFPEGSRWYDFAVTGSNGTITVKEIKKETSPGAVITLHSTEGGTFTVTAKCDNVSEEKQDYCWNSRFEFSGTILIHAQVTVSGDLTKQYDSLPVSSPTVTTNSDNPPYYYYYTQDGTQLDSAPVNAGEYYVQAFVQESDKYTMAESEKYPFTIIQVPTTVTLDAKYNNDGTAHITSEVVGIFPADRFNAGTLNIKIERLKDDNSWEILSQNDFDVICDAGAHLKAEMNTNVVEGGRYKVTAHYNGLVNYAASEVSEIYVRDSGKWIIQGETEYTVSVTTSALTLNLAVSPEIANAEWTSKVVYDSYGSLGFEPTIKIDESEPLKVNIQNVGKAIIRVTVKAPASTEDPAWTYVTVTVTKRTLYAKAFAKTSSSEIDWSDNNAVITNMNYGSIETNANYYQVMYAFDDDTDNNYRKESLYGSWVGNRFGTLEPVILDEKTEAGAAPLTIKKQGATVSVEGKEYQNIFFWRNYDITLRKSTITIDPAKVVLQADNVTVTYGDPEPSYPWSYNRSESRTYGHSEIPSWDTLDDVVKDGAKVTLDDNNRTYQTMAAGEYSDVLILHAEAKENYELVCPDGEVNHDHYIEYKIKSGTKPGKLTINRADITDSSRFKISVKDPVYDGSTGLTPEVMVVDRSRFGEKYTLVGDTDYTLTTGTDGAGKSYVKITGIGNYTGEITENYTMRPVTITVTTASASKIYDGTALTKTDGSSIEGVPASDQDKVSITVTGSQTEVGSSTNTYEITFDEDLNRENYVIKEKLGKLYVAPNTLHVQSFLKDVVYNGLEQKQEDAITVTNRLGQELIKGTDYELIYSYSDEESGSGNMRVINVGTVLITIQGIGAYEGSTTRTYQITPAPLKVDTESARKLYDGAPLTADGEMKGLVAGESASLVMTGTQTEPGSSRNTYKISWNGTAKESNYKIKEMIGTLTVTEPKITYACVSGADSTWKKGSTNGLTFVYKRSWKEEKTFSHFTEVKGDGVTVPASSYDAVSGSLVLTLKSSYLESLKTGQHTLKVMFDDGDAPEVKFTTTETQGEGDDDSGGGSDDEPGTEPSSESGGGTGTEPSSEAGGGTGTESNPESDNGKSGDSGTKSKETDSARTADQGSVTNTSQNTSARTGDESSPELFLMLFLASAAFILLTIRQRRKT